MEGRTILSELKMRLWTQDKVWVPGGYTMTQSQSSLVQESQIGVNVTDRTWKEALRHLSLSLFLSLSHTHTHTQKNTQTHTHTCVCTSQAQVSWEQGQRSHRLNYLAPCQRVFTEKGTIQPCCLGLLWPVIGKGGSSQEENKNHKKKIFKCFFIILSGLFKMTSIYGNEPLNEAI